MNSMILRRPLLGLTSNSLFDSFFDDLFDSFRVPSAIVSQPSTDISYSDDGKALHIDMEVPGYDRKDIQMSINNGVLEVSGTKTEKEEHKDKSRSYMVRETSASFARRIVLPDGADSEKIAAELDHGVLKVTIPVERPEAKRIEIAAPKSKRKAKLASLTQTKSETK